MFRPKPLPIPKSSNTGSVPIRPLPKNKPPTSFTPRPLSKPAQSTSTSSAVPTIQSAPFGMTNMSVIRPPVTAPISSTLPMTSQPAAGKIPDFRPKPIIKPRPNSSNSFVVPATATVPYTRQLANAAKSVPPKPPQLPTPRGPGIPATGSYYSNMFWFLASHFSTRCMLALCR